MWSESRETNWSDDVIYRGLLELFWRMMTTLGTEGDITGTQGYFPQPSMQVQFIWMQY